MRMPHMQMHQALQNQVMQQKAEQESLMQAFVMQQAFAQQQAFNLAQVALQQHQQGDLDQKLSAVSQATDAQQGAKTPQGDQAFQGAQALTSLQRRVMQPCPPNNVVELDQTPPANSNKKVSDTSPALQQHAEEIMRSLNTEMKK
eukprot:9897151-Ditylum_brightwellii.AAC.1